MVEENRMKIDETEKSISDDPLASGYAHTGYAVVKGRFTGAEVVAWIDECERLFNELEGGRHQGARLMGRKHESRGHIIDRLDPVTDISPLFKSLAGDRRLVDTAGVLLGEPAALFKDKLITKPPGTHGYLIHQDYPYWESVGLPADKMLTAWVAIDRATRENGALELFPGLHRERLPGTPEAPMDVDETKIDLSTGELMDLECGDVVFFHSLVPHRSAPNFSTTHRRSVLFTYIPASHGFLYEQYYRKKFH